MYLIVEHMTMMQSFDKCDVLCTTSCVIKCVTVSRIAFERVRDACVRLDW